MTDILSGQRGKHASSSLERARIARGLSREQVARVLGISAKTVERQERRQRGLKRERGEQYARLYGVELQALEDMLVPERPERAA